MSPLQIAVLGAIAGFTIFLGLPIGRLKTRSTTFQALLNAITIGVLTFLLWDVLSHAVEPVEAALLRASGAKHDSWWPFIGLLVIFFGAITVGLLSLVAYDRWLSRFMAAKREARVPVAVGGASAGAVGGAAGSLAGTPIDGLGTGVVREGILRLGRPASRLAFLIAVGIGLHNFSEGLAIGQSAASGEISLAVVLVVGFGLHNATEGFGICAPLTSDERRPGWGQLALLGLIGGGPTVVGTLLGTVFVNDAVSIAFLALAAGSILYVILQLLHVAFKFGTSFWLYSGLLIGLFAGFATDMIVTAAGA
ncbi:ZIP family metal transporter [Rathayibacter soli]|uniref:ZIP family metal transporter n=1 Tax=Rathayibacter soli TaxID=3144168 RepID=UPI0027E490AF|nr:ZIP family metal transporter [Glaciibacter superstes]